MPAQSVVNTSENEGAGKSKDDLSVHQTLSFYGPSKVSPYLRSQHQVVVILERFRDDYSNKKSQKHSKICQDKKDDRNGDQLPTIVIVVRIAH